MSGLTLTQVGVVAGGRQILRDVDLEVPRGRIVAVVGANGAGKTTLLDAVSGIAQQMSGTVAIDGSARSGLPRQGVGRVFQGSPLPATMTVREVVSLVSADHRSTDAVLARFGLEPHETTFVAELSTGMRRILDVAVATVGAPDVLLIDEPASGLARAEIEHLAEVLLRLREDTGAAMLLVEHDVSLVRAVADEVIVLDAGEIVARGTPAEMLSRAVGAGRARVQHPRDARTGAALAAIAGAAGAAPPLPRRSLSTWTILRLGLRQFAAGVASVMILGVLSRVLRVELGVGLSAVTVILSTYNLASPFGLMVGHRSDTRPLFGRRRVPYIIGGAAITGLAVALAPHIAGRLAGGLTPAAVAGSVALFVAMGVGMYGSGTVFFALLADLAPPEERGHVAKVVYLELLGGVLFGVALTGAIVGEGAAGLGTVFALAGVSILLLTITAVTGMERSVSERAEEVTPVIPGRLRTVLRDVAAIPQARLFFAYMVTSTLFFFLHQAVLQPFGGDVFGMSIRQATGLTAMTTVGVVVGMVLAGRPSAEQAGHRAIARWGLLTAAPMFAALALAAVTRSVPLVWITVLGIGVSHGLYNVASLALMMGMATRARAAFFMGAWTVAHALADGAATASGGLIHGAARALGGSQGAGYAAIFAVQAVGLALCLPLLRKVDVGRFMTEAEMLGPGVTREVAREPSGSPG